MADRVTNYVYQTPLTADDLLRQRDFDLISLGKLVSDLLGTQTMASGLAATAVSSTTIPTVELGDGSLYELGTLDPTAYGSLPVGSFPSTANVVKQGLLLASRGDTNQFALAAPTTAGDSVIYLIEAAYSDLDTSIQTITLYNVADPANPTNETQPRQRWGTITIVAKAGIPSSSPAAPTADAGYVPLYAITVAYGQTVLLQSDISAASGAPFLSQKLFNFMNETGTVELGAINASGLITANGGLTVPAGETADIAILNMSGNINGGVLSTTTDIQVGSRIAIFTTTQNWTVPTNITSILISGTAGGGGGGSGGAINPGWAAGGGGGGAGQTALFVAQTVTPGDVISITIGLPGAGGVGAAAPANGNSGSAGGNTVISDGAKWTITLIGGGGGGGGQHGGSSVNGGSGGSGCPGGAPGSNATAASVNSPGGNGGNSSPFTVNNSGILYVAGSGGSGSAGVGNGGSQGGTYGVQGIVVIQY